MIYKIKSFLFNLSNILLICIVINLQLNSTQLQDLQDNQDNNKIVQLDKDESLLIAVPTYNERENILLLCEAIRKVSPDTDILFIDDNSPDGTGIVADEIAAKDSKVKVMHRPSKLGLGTAQVASYEYARNNNYTYLITMDADFTHDPKYIPDIVAARSNADIVIGSRYAEGAEIKNWGTLRLLATRFWRGCLRLGTGMPYDCTGAYRLYRTSILDPEIYKNISSPGYSFGLELLYKLNCSGARIYQVPIVAHGRIAGKSKLSTTEMWQMIKSYAYLIKLRIFGYSKSSLKDNTEDNKKRQQEVIEEDSAMTELNIALDNLENLDNTQK